MNLKRFLVATVKCTGTFVRGCIRWMWRVSCSIYLYAAKEFLPSVFCLLAIYVGVCLSLLLPASMWAWLAVPALAQLASLPVTTFPLAELPNVDTLSRALLAAIPLAIRVFATGSYQEWNKSPEALGARLLFACHCGIIWPKSWWRGARSVPNAQSA